MEAARRPAPAPPQGGALQGRLRIAARRSCRSPGAWARGHAILRPRSEASWIRYSSIGRGPGLEPSHSAHGATSKKAAGMAGAPFRPLGQTEGKTQLERRPAPQEGQQDAEIRTVSGAVGRVIHSPCDGVSARRRNARNAHEFVTSLQGLCGCTEACRRGYATRYSGVSEREQRAPGTGMTRQFVPFLFSRIPASRGAVFAQQVSNLPYKSVSVAGMHRSSGKWCPDMEQDGSVTALLCRQFSDWFIRGVHTRDATCC